MDSLEDLARLIPTDKVLWGVPRGGQIITALLAYRGFQLRQGQHPFAGDCVVDDIADTGKTLSERKRIGNTTAALVVHNDCDPRPDYCGVGVLGDAYVLFPWELDSEVPEMEVPSED